MALNPVDGVRAPKAPKPLPKALSVDLAMALADAPGASDSAAEEAPAITARDQCIVELLYGCGLRVGELVGLDLHPGAAAPAGSTWPTPARTCSARAASGAACRSARRR